MATRGKKGLNRALRRARKCQQEKEPVPMFGPQPDRPGKCNAVVHIADDYGDNSATMKCQLEPGHAGPHVEKWESHDGYDCELRWVEKK
jgi:hypothetical protein